MNVILLSVILGVICMLAYGLSDVLSKSLIHKYGAVKSVAVREVYVVFFSLLLALPFLAGVGDWKMFGLAILLGMAGYLPLLAFFVSLAKSPIGIVAPITGAAPLITLVLSIAFLSSTIGSLQWSAIFLIILANILISLSIKHSKNKEWLEGIPYAIFATVGWGIFFFLVIPIARSLGPWVTPLATEGGILIASFLHLLATHQPINKLNIRDKTIIAPALFIVIASIAYALASQHAAPSIFSPIAQSAGIVAIVVGAIMLHEKLGLRQRILTCVMIIGVILLSIS